MISGDKYAAAFITWRKANERLGNAEDPELIARFAAWAADVDPVRRDEHLVQLDKALLTALAPRRLSFLDLGAWAAHDLRLQPALVVDWPISHVLWRWLMDAHRRRLIEPTNGLEEELSSKTRWDLTTLGAAEQRSTMPLPLRIRPIWRAHWPSLLAPATGAVAAIVAVVVVTALKGSTPVRELLIGAGAGLLLLSVSNFAFGWFTKIRRRPPGGQPWTGPGAWSASGQAARALWTELVLQRALVSDPGLPTLWMDPPPDRSVGTMERAGAAQSAQQPATESGSAETPDVRDRTKRAEDVADVGCEDAIKSAVTVAGIARDSCAPTRADPEGDNSRGQDGSPVS